MLNFDKKNKCFGCTACKKVCPKKAIEMKENEDGFLEPYIIEEKCIKCGMCEKKCPALNYKEEEKISPVKTVSAYKKDNNDYREYTSGGIFFEIAKLVIEEKGYVCGCIWDDEMNAKHIVSNNIDIVRKMQTSKYVQSDLNDCFEQIEKLTQKGTKVLFTGTACQIAGLKSAIDNNDLLYTCEIVCHGVPSPKVWKKYVNYVEKKEKSKLKNVNFRYKGKYGWITPYSKYYFENGKEKMFLTYNEDIYLQGFSKSLFYRSSCYSCIYKGKKSLSDLIIGDFWGCSSELLAATNNRGISIVLVNSEKGNELLDKIYEYYNVREEKLKEVVTENSPIIKPVSPNSKRTDFFEKLNYLDDKKMVKKIKEMTFDKKTYIKGVMYKMGILEKIKVKKYKRTH